MSVVGYRSFSITVKVYIKIKDGKFLFSFKSVNKVNVNVSQSLFIDKSL